VKRRLFLESPKKKFFFNGSSKIPLKLTLDRMITLSKIASGRNCSCLERLAGRREKIIVVSDQGDEESRKIYVELARKTKEQRVEKF